MCIRDRLGIAYYNIGFQEEHLLNTEKANEVPSSIKTVIEMYEKANLLITNSLYSGENIRARVRKAIARLGKITPLSSNVPSSKKTPLKLIKRGQSRTARSSAKTLDGRKRDIVCF
eukprot:TRINITY_DN19217_c0_g1_i2.p1 TRINITY_DN19217_c0_g1~~TRINITY_DN19217_c0_g1_i2.p1  ORF type:complete len:116 (-),score=18.95 TRINITY_DN19217_c0_g1_i2:26-373(-)